MRPWAVSDGRWEGLNKPTCVNQWSGFNAEWPRVHSGLGPGSPFLFLDPLCFDHQWSCLLFCCLSAGLTRARFSILDFPPMYGARVLLKSFMSLFLCVLWAAQLNQGSLGGLGRRGGQNQGGKACSLLLHPRSPPQV